MKSQRKNVSQQVVGIKWLLVVQGCWQCCVEMLSCSVSEEWELEQFLCKTLC